MKLTANRIGIIVHAHEELFKCVERVGDLAGHGSLVSIDGLYNGVLSVTTSEYAGCGDWNNETQQIPVRWLLTDEPREMIEAERKAARIEAERAEAAKKVAQALQAEIQRAEQAEKQKQRDIAELARLKSLYETNQGETP